MVTGKVHKYGKKQNTSTLQFSLGTSSTNSLHLNWRVIASLSVILFCPWTYPSSLIFLYNQAICGALLHSLAAERDCVRSCPSTPAMSPGVPAALAQVLHVQDWFVHWMFMNVSVYVLHVYFRIGRPVNTFLFSALWYLLLPLAPLTFLLHSSFLALLASLTQGCSTPAHRAVI